MKLLNCLENGGWLYLNPSRYLPSQLPLVFLSEHSVPPHDSASKMLTVAMSGGPQDPASYLSPGLFRLTGIHALPCSNITCHLSPLSFSCDLQVSGSYKVTSSLGKTTSTPFLRSTRWSYGFQGTMLDSAFPP